MPHLSVVVTGRNDNYDGNFNERLAIALSKNMASLPDAEFIYVDWNPYMDRPLVCEGLKRIFGDRIRYFAVHPAFHSAYCTFDEFNEYPAKNVAIRRAHGDFIASINSDVVFFPELAEKLKGILKKGVVYRACRVDVRLDYLDIKFPIHPKFILEENLGYMNAAGDFLLMDKDTWEDSTGYTEAFPEQRLHKDAEIIYRLVDLQRHPLEIIGNMTHWRHPSSWSNGFKRDKVGNVYWDFKNCGFVKNPDNWGLTHAKEVTVDGITWLVPRETTEIRGKSIMKTALVLGGHGFIGHHMARRLKKEGFWVRTVDIKEFSYGDLKGDVDDYVVADLRDFNVCQSVFRAPDGKPFDEVYQFSAVMGGAGYIFTGLNDAKVMHDSLLLNINIAEMAHRTKVGKIFYSSSACVYSQLNQMDTNNPVTSEASAYPAYPDSDYGWEKLLSERLYFAYHRNHGLNVRVARFHNIYGMEGSWGNGREKSPSAMCRKIAQTPVGGIIEVWGTGEQTRSYLYIDECLEGIRRFMDSDFNGPLNIGSDEMVSINKLVEMVQRVAGKPGISIKHIPGPIGVQGRTSDNTLIKEKLGWAPDYSLEKGLCNTYPWIEEQVKSGKEDCPWAN